MPRHHVLPVLPPTMSQRTDIDFKRFICFGIKCARVGYWRHDAEDAACWTHAAAMAGKLSSSGVRRPDGMSQSDPASVLYVIDMGDSQTAAHIALLAPVPLDILESALETDTPAGQISFGTRDWPLFNKLEQSRAGMPVDAYIYASHPGGSFEGKATWHARYIRLEPKRHEAKAYRPMLAAQTDVWEGEVYWIVERLRRMEPNEQLSVTDFTPFGHAKPYGKSFPPHRPLLVEHPL